MNKRTEKKYNIILRTREQKKKKICYRDYILKIEVTIIYRVYLPAATAATNNQLIIKNNWTLFRQKKYETMKRLKSD